MKSLSRRAKIIIGIVLGIILVTGGVLVYLQRTGKISIWAATPAFTAVIPDNSFVGDTENAIISPAKKFTVTCRGYSFDKSPSRTVAIVDGTNSSTNISSKKFSTLTSQFSIKSLASGTARCTFANIVPSIGKRKIPVLTLNIYAAQSGGMGGSGGTSGGTTTNPITTDPTSLNLRRNDTQTVSLGGAGSVVTVKCSNGAQAWNGSTAGGTMTFRPPGTNTIVPPIGIKAAPSAASSVCLLYQSTTTTGTPAGQVPVTTYD